MPYRNAIDQPPDGTPVADGQRAPPVIVFGALRSGTTVLRLMMNAHPALANPGEVDFLTDHIRADPNRPDGWRYDLAALRADRMFRAQNIDLPPGLDGLALFHHLLERLVAKGVGLFCVNMHRNLSLILTLLPGARVVHLLRDPRDVARSSVAMGWAGELYFGADHWVATEGDWERVCKVIAPEHRMDLRYEALMTEPRSELARLCDFLGVPYSEKMLSYPAHSTYGPPDPALCRQWEHRCAPREVAELESRIVSLMQARGYPPSQPVQSPGLLRQAQLRVQDWWGRWHFGMRHYGAVPFLGVRLARRLRLKPLERHFQKRVDRRIRQMLR